MTKTPSQDTQKTPPPAQQETPPASSSTPSEELEKLRQEVQEWRNKYLYTLAELDNLQKQFLRERTRSYQKGIREVLLHVLEVLDDLEQARASLDTAESVDAIREGVMLILQKVQRILDAFGVEEISPEGEKFDPLIHEAFAREPVSKPEKNQVILRVLRKGYRIGDHVLRFPRVVVGVYEEPQQQEQKEQRAQSPDSSGSEKQDE